MKKSATRVASTPESTGEFVGISRSELERLRRTSAASLHDILSTVPASRERNRLAQPAIQISDDGRQHRWGSFGEQLVTVAREARMAGHDPRLVRAPTGAGEIDPSGGGFLVAPQYAQELVGFAYEEAVIAPRCDRRPTSTPLADVNIPAIDETSRVDGSRWDGEAATIANSWPHWKRLGFDAKKLHAVMPITNELLADVPLLEAHVRRVFGAEMGFKLDGSVLMGTGAGQLQGIMNSSALITIAKESGQAAATILQLNVDKMWQALPAPSRRTAVWIVNEDAELQLEQMTVPVGASGGSLSSGAAALYMPQGAAGNEYPLLKGRPVLAVEQAPQLGTPGDIVLADLRHFIIIEGALTPFLSVHVRFVNDEVMFRFTLRIDGQSAFSSPLTPFNGSPNKRSPFVALATR